MAKRWTIDEAKGEAVRLAFNARPAVAGAPWCDDLIVRSPTPVQQHVYVGPDGFDALAAAVERDAGPQIYVAEGWWHPSVRSGQVHDHPENPGRGWSQAAHRLCEQVYTRRIPPGAMFTGRRAEEAPDVG